MDKLIEKYFSSLSEPQYEKLNRLEEIYSSWNRKINIVSRKDISNFTLHHVIHSLSISSIIRFNPGTRIMDAGTGGGLPGIPLAIIFPDAWFTLVDSVRKKIKVVDDIVNVLKLRNVNTAWSRVEEINEKFDFVVSRAVAPLSDLVDWTAANLKKQSFNTLANGIIALKGGDLSGETGGYPECEIFELSSIFEEEYFSEKKIVYLPLSK